MIDIPAAADRLVLWTGIPRVAQAGVHPRRLRWWPLLLVLVFLAGGAIMAASHTPSSRMIGYLLSVLAYGTAFLVRLFGPLRTARLDAPLDEREQSLRTKAHAIGYGIVAHLASAGLVWMGPAYALHWPHPRDPMDWLYLFFLMQTLILTLPTLVASWMLKRPLDADEE